MHQILHPKPISNSQNKAAATNNTDSGAVNTQQLAITTLREQIELSATGQAHAQLLDSILALWLDSHVLIASRADHVNDADQKANSLSLWQALEDDVTDLLTYQTIQNTSASTKDKTLATGHSLWCLRSK